MKPTFGNVIGKVDLDGLIKHTQNLTNSLYGLMRKGVTVQDNLPMAYVTVRIVTGRPFQISDSQVPDITGVIIVRYEGTLIKSNMRRVNSGTMEMTVWFEGRESEEFTFLVLGT